MSRVKPRRTASSLSYSPASRRTVAKSIGPRIAGGCTGTGTCTVSMTTAKTVTATFTTSTRLSTTADLSIDVSGGGTVKASGGSCSNSQPKPKTCTQKYDVGKSVTLTAVAAPGAKFTGWTGACFVRTTTCTVSVTSNLSVGATFTTPAFGATHEPKVVRTAHRFEVTLYYETETAGTLKLVAAHSGGAVFLTKTETVQKGAGHVSLVVPKSGRYVFTLTIGKHALRWGIPVR